MAEYTANGFTVTIPALIESANIVTAFSDYHDDMGTILGTLVKKTGDSQTISSPIVLSGGTTISGSSLSVTATTVSMSGTVTLSSTLDVTGLLTATAGVKGDIYANNGSTKILENGTGDSSSLTNAAVQATPKDGLFSGISEVAKASVIYRSSGADYSTPTSFRRIFVGATQPTGPTLEPGDIWMW